MMARLAKWMLARAFPAGGASCGKWSGWDSNPRPPACKAGALPTELPPLLLGRPNLSRGFAILNRRSQLQRSTA
jgi:hypothetical protein